MICGVSELKFSQQLVVPQGYAPPERAWLVSFHFKADFDLVLVMHGLNISALLTVRD